MTRTRPRGFSASVCSDRREAELLERLDLLRDEAERRAERLALEVDVDAEAREPGERVGEVELAVELEVLLLLGREDPVQRLARVVRSRAAPSLRRA